ncbi:MAG: DinB family protein [Pyrinomonadaceae bacterium]|nr:DinB family protein [Pyrinomonadaceae bacterium]
MLEIVELQSLCSFLTETPARVRQLVSGLSERDASWKPSVEEFSAVEHVCHLSDLEREGYGVRIEKLTHETDPFLPDFDGDLAARERDYNSQSLARVLDAFAHQRESNMRVIGRLSADDLQRSGTLETVGPITLETLLHKMREHDEGHLQDLSRLSRQLVER